MRLATYNEVLRAMGVDNRAASKEAAEQALDLSFPIIEDVLESRLEYASVIDYFDLPAQGKGDRFQPLVLRLSRMYVDEDSVIVRRSISGVPLNAPTAGEDIPRSDYQIDQRRGLLTLLRSYPRMSHGVSVQYDAGLVEGAPVPAELQQLAVSAAVTTLNVLPSTPANRKTHTASTVANVLYGYLRRQAGPLARPRMAVQWPAMTEEM